jgi:hypothetical protein
VDPAGKGAGLDDEDGRALPGEELAEFFAAGGQGVEARLRGVRS